MKMEYKFYLKKVLVSLLPWLVAALILVYLLTESLMTSLIVGVLACILIFVVKRAILRSKQKAAISTLLGLGSLLKDNTEVVLEDGNYWSTGIMDQMGVKFYCMVNFSENGLSIKVPTIYRKQLIQINTEKLQAIEFNSDNSALIEFCNGTRTTLPWKSSFNNFIEE